MRYDLPNDRDLLPVSSAAAAWRLSATIGRRLPLLELLQDFRNRQSSEQVDKLYATFSLAEEIASMSEGSFDSLIEPDYRKSVRDVYANATIYLIIEYGNLLVLSQAGGCLKSSDPSWPSWVPVWFEEKPSMEYWSLSKENLHDADGGEPMMIGIPQQKGQLVLQGIEFDAIQSYGDRLTSYGFGYETYQEERDFVMSAWNIFAAQTNHERHPYGNLEHLLRAFMFCMTAGFSSGSKSAESDPDYTQIATTWFFEHARGIPMTSVLQRALWTVLPKPDSGRFHEAFVRACNDRRFFVTKKGYMGMAPESTKEGDLVAIIFGGKVPYIIRSTENGYRFIGDCYVPGLMKGEAVDEWREQGKKQQLFQLV